MSVYTNRDLCRRHIPVVVNAIDRLQQNQNDRPERQPYVATFSLTGEDGQVIGGFKNTGDATYTWVFPQRYAAIFNAATADPNILIHIKLTITDEDGVSVSENMTANKPTSAIASGYAKANYYPDSSIVQKIIDAQLADDKLKTETIVSNQLENIKGNYSKTTGELTSLSTEALYGTIPYIVTNAQVFMVSFYYLDDLLRKLKVKEQDGKKIMNFSDLPDMVKNTSQTKEQWEEYKPALMNYIREHVTLNVFDVSGIYVPPNP